MAINVQKVLDIIQSKLNAVDSDASITEIGRLGIASKTVQTLKNAFVYANQDKFPRPEIGNQGRMYYSSIDNKYYLSHYYQWKEIDLVDSDQVYQGPTYQGTVEGYTAGGLDPQVAPLPATTTRYSNPFSSDTTISAETALLSQTLSSSPSNSDTRGYVVGSHNNPSPTTMIQSFDFASQTTQVDTGTLSIGSSIAAGNSSKANGYGYSVAGLLTTAIQRFAFASNVTSVVDIGRAYTSATPSTINSAKGLNSNEKGYITGGSIDVPSAPVSPQLWGRVLSYPFTSNVPGTVITADLGSQPLTPQIRYHGAWSTDNNGYVGGGWTPPTVYLDTANRFPFSSETYIALSPTPGNARAFGANYNDANAGYIMGGRVNSPNTFTAGNSKYIFSSETYSTPAGFPGPHTTMEFNTGNHQ